MSNIDVVRAVFDAYLQQNRAAMDRLLAAEFVFTSPQDDHIDKAAFFERCFPTAGRLTSQEIVHVVPADDDGVFAMYVYQLKTGTSSQRRAADGSRRPCRRDPGVLRRSRVARTRYGRGA